MSWWVLGCFLSPALASRRGAIRPSLRRTLTRLVPNVESATIVGHEYLRLAPRERNVPLLLMRLGWENPTARSSLSRLGELRLGRMIHRRISDDFREERTVNLRGWVVSRTEARLCALVALEVGDQ
jgi:hypothetical protein